MSSPACMLVENLLRQELDEHRSTLEATARAVLRPLSDALDIMESSMRMGGKLLLFGNGGSAADAQHIAAELVVRYRDNRAPIAAIALTTDTSTLTACGNDLGFDRIFARQVEALGRRGDVAFGISTSGRSVNVLEGLRQAKRLGLHTVGLCGETAGDMRDLCDALIVIPSTVTARIQEMHITLGHVLCKGLEDRLGLS